jgi:hypothetical protein
MNLFLSSRAKRPQSASSRDRHNSYYRCKALRGCYWAAYGVGGVVGEFYYVYYC